MLITNNVENLYSSEINTQFQGDWSNKKYQSAIKQNNIVIPDDADNDQEIQNESHTETEISVNSQHLLSENEAF